MASETILVHIAVKGGLEAIAWYEKAFGARQAVLQMAEDGARVLHATLAVFGGHVMLHDVFPEFDHHPRDPQTLGGASGTIHIAMPSPAEIDAAIARASAEGAVVSMPPQDMFWGDYYGRLIDPYGHHWSFGAPNAAASAAG